MWLLFAEYIKSQHISVFDLDAATIIYAYTNLAVGLHSLC